MKKTDAIAHFGTQQKLADTLNRAQSTIAEWPDAVPLEHALVLEVITKGKKNALRIDPALYPKLPPAFLARRNLA